MLIVMGAILGAMLLWWAVTVFEYGPPTWKDVKVLIEIIISLAALFSIIILLYVGYKKHEEYNNEDLAIIQKRIDELYALWDQILENYPLRVGTQMYEMHAYLADKDTRVWISGDALITSDIMIGSYKDCARNISAPFKPSVLKRIRTCSPEQDIITTVIPLANIKFFQKDDNIRTSAHTTIKPPSTKGSVAGGTTRRHDGSRNRQYGRRWSRNGNNHIG